VNIVWAAVGLVVVTAVAVAAMLLVRRRAPEGSYFIIFLAFSSYDASRSGAETEATIVAQQLQTAQFLPAPADQQLSGELTCYARYVAGPEWDALADGTLGDAVNPWGVAMYRTIATVNPRTDTQQSAYDRWMDQTSAREQARIDRVHGAEGILPWPLWAVLFLISAVIFVYLLFFADPAEGAVTQGLLMGSVTVVIALLLMLLMFFDHPHGNGPGRLQPTAMQRTVRLIEIQAQAAGITVTAPCDARGNPR
jgi:hypothetical protein